MLVKPNIFKDVMNGRAYKFEDNTFNLILFADAVTYNKSGNTSMWAIFSSIVGIPLCLVAIYLVKTISSKQESIVNNG